jgi:hypothetical protein
MFTPTVANPRSPAARPTVHAPPAGAAAPGRDAALVAAATAAAPRSLRAQGSVEQVAVTGARPGSSRGHHRRGL